MPAGRPAIAYNPELGDAICEMIATTDMGMVSVLEALKERFHDVPSLPVIYRWLRDVPEFAEQSARARELQGDTIIDTAIRYAKEPLIATTSTSKEWGEEVKIGDNVQRSQLIVQTLLKRAGQLAPKKYGDKIQQEVTGENGGPLVFKVERTK